MAQTKTESTGNSGASPAPRAPLEFTVRPLRAGDAPALAAFYAALSPASRYFFEPYADTSVEAMEGVVRRAVSGEDLSLAVLTLEDGIVAHLFYRDVGVDVPHLGIGLLDAYQDRGLGATLLVHLIGLGRHVLYKKTIGLTVMKENRRALHLYEKYGFRVVRDVTFRTEHDSLELWLAFEGEPAVQAPGCGMMA